MTESIEELRLARMQRLFRMSLRPMPKFTRLLEAVRDVDDQYGEFGEGFIDLRRLIELHEAISTSTSLDVVKDEDLRHVGRLLFLDVDDAHRALYPNEAIRRSAFRRIESAPEVQLRTGFLRNYCMSEAPFSGIPGLNQAMESIARQTPRGAAIVRCGFFGNAPARALLDLIPKDRLIADVLPELTEGLVRRISPVAREVWKARVPQYGMRIATAINNEDSPLQDVLAFILHDSTDGNGSLRWPGFENELAGALLNPFIERPDLLPSEEEEDLLAGIMLRLFGHPEDPEARWKWVDIEKRWRELVEHWLHGRQLNGALELVHELTDPSGDFIRHWEERERYWKAYWRAGRLRGCRVYFKKALCTSFRWTKAVRLRQASHNRLDISGRLYGGNQGIDQMVLLMQLDDDVLVAEVNYNGSMHIGRVAQRDRLSAGTRNIGPWKDFIDYAELRYLEETVPHQSGWQGKASSIIRKMTGHPAPAGTLR